MSTHSYVLCGSFGYDPFTKTSWEVWVMLGKAIIVSSFVKSKTYFFISYQPLWHSTLLHVMKHKISRRANRYRTWWRVFVLILSLSTKVNAVHLRTVCHLLLQSTFVNNWNLLYIRIYRGFQFVLVGTDISSILTTWFTLCIMRVMCVICNSIYINVDSQLYHLW